MIRLGLAGDRACGHILRNGSLHRPASAFLLGLIVLLFGVPIQIAVFLAARWSVAVMAGIPGAWVSFRRCGEISLIGAGLVATGFVPEVEEKVC